MSKIRLVKNIKLVLFGFATYEGLSATSSRMLRFSVHQGIRWQSPAEYNYSVRMLATLQCWIRYSRIHCLHKSKQSTHFMIQRVQMLSVPVPMMYVPVLIFTAAIPPALLLMPPPFTIPIPVPIPVMLMLLLLVLPAASSSQKHSALCVWDATSNVDLDFQCLCRFCSMHCPQIFHVQISDHLVDNVLMREAGGPGQQCTDTNVPAKSRHGLYQAKDYHVQQWLTADSTRR